MRHCQRATSVRFALRSTSSGHCGARSTSFPGGHLSSRRLLSSQVQSQKSIYLIAGEASGDELGARVMQGLKRAGGGNLAFAGIGGSRMISEGLRSLFPMGDLSIMGFAEVIPHIFKLHRRLDATVDDIVARRPAVVVTVDSKGFASRVRERVRQASPKFVHYVGPTTLWLDKDPRVLKPYRDIDHMLLLFPFERQLYPASFPCTVTGHPLLEETELHSPLPDKRKVLTSLGLPEDTRLIGTFPGSRTQEVRRIMPAILDGLQKLRKAHPSLHALVVSRDPVSTFVKKQLRNTTGVPHTLLQREAAITALKACDAAVAVSGSVVLEIAASRVPMVVLYKTSGITAKLTQWRFPQLKHVSLVNILLSSQSGPSVVPELLQDNCNPTAIADALHTLLTSPDATQRQLKRLPQLLSALSPPEGGRPSNIAAKAILAQM